MARCGCGSGACGCVVTAAAGSGITVSGSGTLGSPFLLNFVFTVWANITGTYVNSFSAYTGTAADVPQYRTFLGGKLVQLRGRVLGTTWTPINTNMITGLPVAIRPVRTKYLAVYSDDVAGDNGQITITNAGVMVNQCTYPDTYISLDGIWYETD